MKCALGCHGAPRLLAASVLLALALALPVHSQGSLHNFPTSCCDIAEHLLTLSWYQSAFDWPSCLAVTRIVCSICGENAGVCSTSMRACDYLGASDRSKLAMFALVTWACASGNVCSTMKTQQCVRFRSLAQGRALPGCLP